MTKKIMILVLFSLATSCNAEERRKEAIKYLEERKFELGGNGIVISNIVGTNISVIKKDLEKICDIGTMKSIFFRSSHLEKNAVRGLEGCDKLEYIAYEKGSTLPLDDIPDHDRIPHLQTINFNGTTYGDDLMPYLAKLERVHDIFVRSSEWDEKAGYGILTGEGIRKFAESRTAEGDLRLTLLFQPKLNDSAFEHFLKLRGLKYIDFGSKTGVTEAGVNRFGEEYKKRYGVDVTIVYGM